MKKKSIYIFTRILLLLLLFSGLFVFRLHLGSVVNTIIGEIPMKYSIPDICKLSMPYVGLDEDIFIDFSRKQAINKCYNSYALKKLSLPVCEKIRKTKNANDYETGLYKSCIYNVTKNLNLLTVEKCTEFKNHAIADFGVCITDIAIISNDNSLCNKYLNTDKQLYCLKNVARTSGDVSFCYQFYKKYSEDWNNCVSSTAFSIKDASLCDQHLEQGSRFRIFCIGAIVQMTKDVSLCDRYFKENSRDRNSCTAYYIPSD